MKQFYHNGKLVALHIRVERDGSCPATSKNSALQVLTLKHPKGHVAKPHRHLPKRRLTTVLHECLVVIKGRVRYDLYDARGRCFKHFTVRTGEAALVWGIAHSLIYLEASEIIEVKNGPFVDDKKFL